MNEVLVNWEIFRLTDDGEELLDKPKDIAEVERQIQLYTDKFPGIRLKVYKITKEVSYEDRQW